MAEAFVPDLVAKAVGVQPFARHDFGSCLVLGAIYPVIFRRSVVSICIGDTASQGVVEGNARSEPGLECTTSTV